ncbi:MAG: DUF975 family protein [Clostridia bacterium]|nr:DUF975 family protein [Clostridia bacterium]
MDRYEIKALAKEQIKGNVLTFLLALFIFAAIASSSGIIPIIALIVTPILTMGLIFICMDIRDGKGVQIERLFAGFSKDFGRLWCSMFLVELFTALWTCVFIIPGIVKGLSYSMTPFIIAEDKEISAQDAIKKSMAMMEGHKWDLFVLYLSFIGWILLVAITFGIALIYVEPYMCMAKLNFYDKIKNEKFAEAPETSDN